jgi:hypothetical protein
MARTPRRSAPWLLLVGLLGGCGAATPSAGAAWKELRIAWDFGPCPDDGRSCHQVLVVTHDGGFVAAETPNAPGSVGVGEPVRRFDALDPQEIRELHRIVTPAFVEAVGSFGCPAAPDSPVTLEIVGASGTRKEAVGGCVHASEPKPSPPRALVELLDRHRWATRDVKPTSPRPPSGEGDPCHASIGCGPGLTCDLAPCAVAPCTSGACRKAR